MKQENIFKPVKEYAQEKGVSVQAIYQAIKSGKLKSKKIGSYTLVQIT